MNKVRVCAKCLRPVTLEIWLEWLFGDATWQCAKHGKIDSPETIKIPEPRVNYAPLQQKESSDD